MLKAWHTHENARIYIGHFYPELAEVGNGRILYSHYTHSLEVGRHCSARLHNRIRGYSIMRGISR